MGVSARGKQRGHPAGGALSFCVLGSGYQNDSSYSLADRYSYAILVCRRARRGEWCTLPVKHAILGLLARAPRHGYELKSEFDLLTGGFWELNIGQVYSTLERLLKDGLVVLDEGEGEGDDRKVYQITTAGTRELEAWLGRPPLKPRPLRDEILVRLGLLLSRSPAEALGLIESQRRLCHLHLAGLTRQKLGLKEPAVAPAVRAGAVERLRHELLLDAAIAQAEAELHWLEHCETKIGIFLGR